MNKRGVSPLIATVLLIAFAVSLGAVVMNLGVNFGRDVCEQVDFEALTLGGVPDACLSNDNELRLTLHNIGIPVDGYRITILSNVQGADYAKEFSDRFKEAEKKTVKIPNAQVAEPRILSITAYVKDQGLVKYCSKQSKDYTPVRRC